MAGPEVFLFGPEAPPFQEAVDYFLAKQIVPRHEFDDMAAEMRVKAFTAAHVFAADQLQAVYDACGQALQTGQTLADFRKATEGIFARPWHRETVFRTNVLSAYGRGHWEQAQATREARPYARYSAVMDGRTRPRHAALHGLVFPLDHPFWKTYWPPWDYNCRCAAITLNAEQVEKEGLTVRRELPPDLPPPGKFVSPAAGEWQPDLSKYADTLRNQLTHRLLEKSRIL